MTIRPIRFAGSRGRLLAIALVAATAAVLLSASTAQAATKYFDSFFGTTLSGVSTGGTFTPNSTSHGSVGDIAVNDPGHADGNGADGWIYVVDRGNNRIQAFDQDKDFQWAIGRDVIASSVNEQQLVTVNATAGTFTLTFNGSPTTNIAENASTSTVDNALDVLPSIGADANVTVQGSTGGPYTVTFTGALAAANQPQMTVDATLLTGTASVSTIADGLATVPGDLGDAFEKCTVAAHCKAGSVGTATDGPGGEFNGASGIDVDQDSGDFYIRERNSNARVQQFTADGDFVRAFGWDVVLSGPGNDVTGTPNELETCNAAADICKAGVTGTNVGQLGSSTAISNGLAIAPVGAPNAGTVYAADPGNRRVLPFTVPSDPTAAVTAGAPFGSSTEFGGANHPVQLAADENGVVYGSDDGVGSVAIERFDTVANAFKSRIAGDSISVLGTGLIRSIEVDQASGHLWVARNPGVGIMELDVSANPVDVDMSNLVETHVAGLNIGSPEDTTLGAKGIGINPVSGELFVSTGGNSNTGSGTGNRVLVLDDTGIDPPPTIELLPAFNVGATTATLRANINPNGPTGFPTRYRFQVSKSGLDDDWTDVASEQLVGVDGDGGTSVFIDDPATGLEPNTLYNYRIVTTRRPDAGTAISAELIFKTDPAPPVVDTRPAQHVSDVGARLIGNLNPGGLTTDYWFEWGDNNYGNTAPVPAEVATGGIDRLVGMPLLGLAPDQVYHFRLCAQNSLSPEKVCGADRTFTTRAAATSPTQARAYEMVLAPLKPLRRGGERGRTGLDYARREAGIAASDGTFYRSHLFAGATDADAGHGFTRAFSHERRRRDPGGIWHGDAIFNLAPVHTAANNTAQISGESADLRVSAWRLLPSVFADAGNEDPVLALRAIGDTGGPRGAGWYPWLLPAWFAGNLFSETWAASIDDQGRRLVAQSGGSVTGGTLMWRDVTPVDDTRSPSQLTPPQAAGHAVFLSGAEHQWRPSDLVNECTGSAGSATVVPSRDDNGTPSGPAGSFSTPGATYTTGSTTIDVSPFVGGSTANVRVGHFISGPGIPAGARVTAVTASQVTISHAVTSTHAFPGVTITGGQNTAAFADDTVGVRSCESGSPTNTRGAVMGSSSGGRLGETRAAAMSESGDRVFFLSPDPSVAEGQAACEVGDADVGAGTRCPAQLFVRQFDDEGNPIVRWLSRPEDALFEDGAGDPQQSPAAVFGHGVAFEGASRDGSVVYFRTNAPLLEDDPNGGEDPLTSASPLSWDLYRYDLGADNNADPGIGDPGDRLTRISGGPDPANPADPKADPNTNCVADASDCGGVANGAGQVVRFVSDDGDRVYFVTTAQIPGADNAPPAESSAANQPTGPGDQDSAGVRNIYAYDVDETGPAAYRFVARVPFTTASDELDGCLSAHGRAGYMPRRTNMQGFSPASATAQIAKEPINCVRGSGSGDAIVFETTAQLTADDTDAAGDVYAYDADADRLARLSAPSPDAGAGAYPCVSQDHDQPPSVSCNGDLGFGMIEDAPGESTLVGSRHTNVAQDADGNLTAVYFESRLPLVANDFNVADSTQNGGMDVYRWGRDGRLSLVSPGNSDDSAFYAGNSLDGKDVFFWTEQRLSAWEVDQSDGDVYNATTRTDLRPDPSPPPPVCGVLAGSCQLGGGEQRTPTPVATTGEGGASDEPAPRARRGELSLRTPSGRALRRAARSGVLALRVRAAGPGRVRLRAVAKIGGRSMTVARRSRRFRRAATATVRLRLNARARRQLRLRRALELDVVARPSSGHAKTLNLTLRRGGRR